MPNSNMPEEITQLSGSQFVAECQRAFEKASRMQRAFEKASQKP